MVLSLLCENWNRRVRTSRAISESNSVQEKISTWSCRDWWCAWRLMWLSAIRSNPAVIFFSEYTWGSQTGVILSAMGISFKVSTKTRVSVRVAKSQSNASKIQCWPSGVFIECGQDLLVWQLEANTFCRAVRCSIGNEVSSGSVPINRTDVP